MIEGQIIQINNNDNDDDGFNGSAFKININSMFFLLLMKFLMFQ